MRRLKLLWTDTSQIAVTARSIVKLFDVIRNVRDSSIAIGINSFLNTLLL